LLTTKNICVTLAAIFTSRAYEARVAYSAEQAVQVIAEWQPDLAILDVGLPNMNGIDLTIALKASYSTCPILLFSGQPNTIDLLEQAAESGHLFEVLAKPVLPNLMLDTAANLLPQILKKPSEMRQNLTKALHDPTSLLRRQIP
jgi:CheY-like chemotaxis protein